MIFFKISYYNFSESTIRLGVLLLYECRYSLFIISEP